MVILDIELTNGGLITICIIAALVLVGLISSLNATTKEKNKLKQDIKEAELQAKKNEAELKVTYQNWAIGEFEKFKQQEISNIQKAAEKNAIESAVVLLQRWKIENEASIRQDAINRSYSVNLGKITEHLLPFHVKFPFNPKDVRFIGSPIDLIVFDGHSEEKDDIKIWIVEVKTGTSKLTKGQLKIKNAVKNAEIRWYELNPDDESSMEIATNKLSNNPQTQLPLDNIS